MTDLKLKSELRLEAEKALSNKLSRLFTATERQILTRFLKIESSEALIFQVQEILKPLMGMDETYFKTILDANNKAMFQGRQNTLDLLNITAKKKYTLFDFDPRIYSQMRNQTFIASQKTMARVKGNVEKNIANSYQNGLGIKDAARNLKKEFRNMKTYEVNRIARTEINSAQNTGAFETYKDYDIHYHQWWTGGGRRTRDSHKKIHGVIVPINTMFPNGLLYPGDRNGPIREWIHCRCTTVPYLMPLGYMAPPNVSSFHESDIIKIPDFEIPRISI